MEFQAITSWRGWCCAEDNPAVVPPPKVVPKEVLSGELSASILSGRWRAGMGASALGRV